MGKRDNGDAWKRFREREDEDEKQNEAKQDTGGGKKSESRKAESNEELRDLIQKADPMIEQINSLYQMYIAGAEQLPPLEKRKLLETMLLTIQNSTKAVPALQFKAQTIQSKFTLYRDRWDKMMRDLEKGIIKRRLK